jgi:hypothetical protein
MADDKKDVKGVEPKRARTAPGLDVKLVLGLFVVLLIAAAAYFYLQQGEKELSLTEFKALLNSTPNVAVVQDLRAMPPGDYAARQNLQNCGIQTAFILSYLGKNVTNYVYEGESCYGMPTNATPAQCGAQFKEDGRYVITVSYAPGDGKTKFYASHAAYSGDAAFLQDCAISKIAH